MPVIYAIHNCTHINKTSQYTHLTKFHKFTAQVQVGVIKRFKHIFVNEHFLTLTNAQQQSLQNADVVTVSLLASNTQQKMQIIPLNVYLEIIFKASTHTFYNITTQSVSVTMHCQTEHSYRVVHQLTNLFTHIVKDSIQSNDVSPAILNRDVCDHISTAHFHDPD